MGGLLYPARQKVGTRRRARTARERGAAAVEFALSLVLLIPLLFGTVNYGYYFWIAITATEAAQLATRTALTNGSTLLTVCPTALTTPALAVQQAAAKTAAQNHINARTGLPTSYVTFPGDLVTNDICSPVPFGWIMQVQVDFPPIAPFTLPFMPSSTIAGRTRVTTKTFVLPP